jgi:hypothetical protein
VMARLVDHLEFVRRHQPAKRWRAA